MSEDDEPQEVCGFSYDHIWSPGDMECQECGADLSEWNMESDDDES